MREYLIPVPYTFTIIALIIINAVALYVNRKKINWKKYLSVQAFTFLFGIAQIHGLENLGNVAVPCCSSLFYYFMFKIKNVPDFLKNKCLVKYGLLFFVILEALIYQAGGEGCRVLMIAYTLIPLVVLLIIGFDFKNINITHPFFTLLFCFVINCGWDFANAYLRRWIYDVNCDLLGEHGWFFNDLLHVSIFVQYAVSGFTVMYFSNIYFESMYGSKRIC
jgi:hypothetical protein